MAQPLIMLLFLAAVVVVVVEKLIIRSCEDRIRKVSPLGSAAYW